MLIIKPFNKTYNIQLIVYAIITLIISIILKITHNSYLFLIIFSIINLLFFIVYRSYLLFDKEYLNNYYGDEKNYVFNELPLYPCNIITIFYFIGLIFKKNLLIAYSFYFSFVGPILAILVPSDNFKNHSLFKFRIFSYYFTHIASVMMAIFLVVTKTYIPNYKDAFYSIILITIISFIIHLINVYFIEKNLYKKSNYFYTIRHDNISILKFFYDHIKLKYVYLFPAILIVFVIYLIITFITLLIL